MIPRLIGFIASLIFTLAAFFVIRYQMPYALLTLLTLAILQAIAQSIFFLHILSEKGPRWNLHVYVSTIGIVIIIIAFTIWILNHLNYNMMMKPSF